LKAGTISATSPQGNCRFTNCLRHGNIVFVGDLGMRTKKQMMLTPIFGRKSRDQVAAGGIGLHLGMKVPGWPLDEMARRYVDAH
jgi:DNA-directed RNA polymerase subunit alpha